MSDNVGINLSNALILSRDVEEIFLSTPNDKKRKKETQKKEKLFNA